MSFVVSFCFFLFFSSPVPHSESSIIEHAGCLSFLKAIFPGDPRLYRGEDGQIVSVKPASVEPIDEFFDLVFVIGFVHLGSKFRSLAVSEGLVNLFSHWFPLFFNWYVLEGYVNRFAGNKGVLRFVYLASFVSLVGTVMNIEPCVLSSFDSVNTPYPCRDFTFFLFMARVTMAFAWLIAAFSCTIARSYVWWRAFTEFLIAAIFLSAAFLQSSWLGLPVVWFVGIGLDIFLHWVPMSFLWNFDYLPRNLVSGSLCSFFFFFPLSLTSIPCGLDVH